jgi:hypothetical protein
MSSPRHFFGALLGLPLLVGAVVRVAGLRTQIVLDDEVHAVRVALGRTLDQILSHYPLVDVSIPLAALDRLALDLGLPLSETALRAPALIAGLLAVSLIPLLLHGRIPPRASLLLGLLLALSPWLVFYSRFARPYMLVTLSAFLALLLFRRFAAGGRLLDGVGYAACAALSVWLFFLAAPLVLAPILWGLLPQRSTTVGEGRALRRRAAAALIGLALLSLLLFAPLLDDISRAFEFHVGPHPSAEPNDRSVSGFSVIFVGGLSLLSGSTHWLGGLLFWAFVARGAWLHRTIDRPFFRFCSFAVLVHLAAMTSALALRLSHLFPVAFARYLVLLLPLLYLWAALGLITPIEATRTKGGSWVHGALALAFLALWLGDGPYQAVAEAGFHSSFAGSKQAFAPRLEPRGPVRGQQLYTELAHDVAGTVVLESPGDEHDSILRLYAENQRIHKHRVMVTEFPMVDGSRLAFRNMIRPGPTAILRSEASHLVLHLDLLQEVRQRFGPVPRHLEPRGANHAILARRLASDLRRAWGPPDHEDGSIVAWDLDRVRGAGRSPSE